ncbi:MAG: hypothetical protein IT460_06910 [Planctomycetes bacterium]|nr:hypothetical protein [Planctomycetota bacterium]
MNLSPVSGSAPEALRGPIPGFDAAASAIVEGVLAELEALRAGVTALERGDRRDVVVGRLAIAGSARLAG